MIMKSFMMKKCNLLPHPYTCIGKDCCFAEEIKIPIESMLITKEFSIPESLYLEDNQPRIERHIAYIVGVEKVKIKSISKIGYVFYDLQRSVLLDIDFQIINYARKYLCSQGDN